MSARGYVAIECDVPGCHAEQVFSADDLMDTRSVVALAEDAGWRRPVVRWTCPQCIEEGKRA